MWKQVEVHRSKVATTLNSLNQEAISGVQILEAGSKSDHVIIIWFEERA